MKALEAARKALAEKKKRWTSVQRAEKKKGKVKPDKIRWKLQLKKFREMKDAHKAKRQKAAENRKKLMEKGVIKKA